VLWDAVRSSPTLRWPRPAGCERFPHRNGSTWRGATAPPRCPVLQFPSSWLTRPNRYVACAATDRGKRPKVTVGRGSARYALLAILCLATIPALAGRGGAGAHADHHGGTAMPSVTPGYTKGISGLCQNCCPGRRGNTCRFRESSCDFECVSPLRSHHLSVGHSTPVFPSFPSRCTCTGRARSLRRLSVLATARRRSTSSAVGAIRGAGTRRRWWGRRSPGWPCEARSVRLTDRSSVPSAVKEKKKKQFTHVLPPSRCTLFESVRSTA